MDKRLILFLIISLAIIFSYPYFLEKVGIPTTPSPDSKDSTNTETGLSETKPGSPPSPVSPVSPAEARKEEPISTGVAVATKEKVIESDLYRVVLSSAGGSIKEWRLKKYTKNGENGDQVPIELVPKAPKTYPLTIVDPGTGNGVPLLFNLDEKPVLLSPEKPEERVVLTAVGADGRTISKEMTFHYDRYSVEIQVKTEGYPQGYTLSLGTNFGIEDWGEQFGGGVGQISLINGEVQKEQGVKVEGVITHEGSVAWTGLQDKYFVSALIPKNPEGIGPVSVMKEGEKEIRADLKVPPARAAADFFTLYAGPKEYDRLVALHVHLEETIDFGWFIAGSWLPVRLVAKPIFYLLRFFYQFSQNYGIAIILVTVLVKALFFPITRMSLRSMKEMAAVQPKIAEVRKKYAGDRDRMNRELMNLYKENRINPFGGCLPMIVQIPFFVSLFNILYTTIDLRQAPFMLWIHDLSGKDPYYVLPVIMGISMFFQQWTQPSTMDPTQAKVMLFLPVIYTFFFLNFPSGLVLYWLVNNLLSIGQQYLMNREGLVLQK